MLSKLGTLFTLPLAIKVTSGIHPETGTMQVFDIISSMNNGLLIVYVRGADFSSFFGGGVCFASVHTFSYNEMLL